MTPNARQALEEVLALVDRATPGEWRDCRRGFMCSEGTGREECDVDGPDGETIDDAEFVAPSAREYTVRGQMFHPDAEAIVAAVNYLRQHGVTLRAALDAGERDRVDAERYRWLRRFYASADFEPGDHDGMDLIFGVPQGEVSADCDKTIDGLIDAARGNGGA